MGRSRTGAGLLTSMVVELYQALKAAGVEDDIARAAAKSVIAIEDKSQLATKADLQELRSDMRLEMAELKMDLIRWSVGTMIAMGALFAAIVRFLRCPCAAGRQWSDR